MASQGSSSLPPPTPQGRPDPAEAETRQQSLRKKEAQHAEQEQEARQRKATRLRQKTIWRLGTVLAASLKELKKLHLPRKLLAPLLSHEGVPDSWQPS